MNNLTIFYLLRLGLWEDDPKLCSEIKGRMLAMPLPTDDDWRKLIGFMTNYNISGLMMNSMQFISEVLNPPISFYEAVLMDGSKNMSVNLQSIVLLRKVAAFLKLNNIPYSYINNQARIGLSNTIRMLNSELDFYVGNRLEDAVHKLIVEKVVGDPITCNSDEVLFGNKDVCVKLLRYPSCSSALNQSDHFQNWVEEEIFSETVDVNGTEVVVPSVSMELLLRMVQLLESHVRTCEVGLEHCCELSRFLYTNYTNLNQDKLCGWIHQMHVLTQWQIVGCIAVDLLGLPEERFPMYNPNYKDWVGRACTNGSFLCFMLKDL